MSKTQPTSVRFPKSMDKVREELAQIYGLHNVVCAGLLLFNQLDPVKQKEAIRQVYALEADDMVSAAEAAALARKRKQNRSLSKSG